MTQYALCTKLGNPILVSAVKAGAQGSSRTVELNRLSPGPLALSPAWLTRLKRDAEACQLSRLVSPTSSQDGIIYTTHSSASVRVALRLEALFRLGIDGDDNDDDDNDDGVTVYTLAAGMA